MHKAIYFYLICHTYLMKSSQYVINFNTGWIPISREDILKRMSNTNFISDNNAAESSQNMQILRENAIKVVAPEKQLLAFNFPPDTAAVEESHRKTNECQIEACHSNVVKNNYEINISSENEEMSKNASHQENIRKPKAITTSTLGENNLRITQGSHRFEHELGESKLQLLEKDNKNDEQDSPNNYKVTEDTDHFIEPTSDESKQDINGYQYQSPDNNINFLGKTNLTSSFLSILNRYNIKPEDQSKNYIISRNKVYIPKQNYMFVPIPSRPRYNNLNHLPVDPLIAVFLSNYGYYLPSYYGIHNNYRNLYGYLASNNIHNNLPFGLYKIFSDTDSYN